MRNWKRLVIESTFGVCALAASGAVSALCSTTTLAQSTLAQSGQGNLDCSAFGPNVMSPVSADVTTGAYSTDFTTTVDADVVVVEAADGKRCVYLYPGDSDYHDTNLQPGGNKTIKNVLVCADQTSGPPSQPVATSTDGCVGPSGSATGIQDGVNGNLYFQNAVAFGNDPDGNPTVAACSNNAVANQVQCVNRCVPHTPDPATDCTPDTNGEIPLDCRACELSSVVPVSQPNVPADTEYCWEYSHAVCEAVWDDSGGAAYDPDSGVPENCPASTRTAGTFIRPLPTEPGHAEWHRYKGSSCYLISLNFGGIQYDYWSPAGCP